MSEKPINNLQDKLFRYIFKRKEAAVGFFKNYLPEKLVELIVWSTLELESGSFVDEQWRDRYSDLVFSVRAVWGQELKLSCFLSIKALRSALWPFDSCPIEIIFGSNSG